MNCPSCSTGLPEGAVVCPSCGASVDAPSQMPTASVGGEPAASTVSAMPVTGSTLPGPSGAVTGGPAHAVSVGGPATAMPGTNLPAFKLDTTRWSRTDRIVGGATLVLFISFFLSWFDAKYDGVTYSGSGLSAHGYLYIPLILAIALVLYLVAKAGFTELPFKLPISDQALFATVTGINLLFVLLGFFVMPSGPGIGWDYGAFIGLIAALVAFYPFGWPIIQSQLAKRRATS